MTSSKKLPLFVWIFFIAYLPVGFGQGISGRVVAESGEPLSGVRILNLYLEEATTDEGGRFEITSKFPAGQGIEQVARFTRAGYRPTTRVVIVGAPAEVVLQKSDGVSSTWTPPFCSSTKDMMVGGLMAFTLPKGARVVRGEDIDYSVRHVAFKGSFVRLGWGPNWSWGVPRSAFFKGISKLEERDLGFHPDVPVAEYKGIRSNGKYFRQIHMLGETVEYEDASREAAAFFDAILDTLCWTRRRYAGPLK